VTDKFTPVGEEAPSKGLCLSPEQAGNAQQQSSSDDNLLGKLFGR
jgi:hypothetical protein